LVGGGLVNKTRNGTVGDEPSAAILNAVYDTPGA
jgi:hypothetical protein